MNHGTAFQDLWRRLRNDVRELQTKGYYGDGYWSSGKRLADSATISGNGINPGELPEYMVKSIHSPAVFAVKLTGQQQCGGAHARSRPSNRRRKPRRREVVPSNHTGRQTTKKRKPGSRVASKYAFLGDGLPLHGDSGHGAGKGKRANSNRAREERALAAERRLQTSEQQSEKASTSRLSPGMDSDNGSDSDIEFIETDTDRRKVLLDSGLEDPSSTAISWEDFDDDCIFVGAGQTGVVPLSKGTNDVIPGSSDHTKGKRKADNHGHVSTGPRPKVLRVSERNESDPSMSSIRGMVQGEIRFRRQESLGMQSGKARQLGAIPSSVQRVEPPGTGIETRHGNRGAESDGRSAVAPKSSSTQRHESAQWSCLVCTL
ncbi:hypothetical protein PQX77_003722 [Marasmius sp. AFHP31]|nr:hypothetical protein PQX77_003722 [Marasmius sp. AFHP31]